MMRDLTDDWSAYMRVRSRGEFSWLQRIIRSPSPETTSRYVCHDDREPAASIVASSEL